MASFNSITILGNCTRDVEMRFLPNQTAVAEWGIATNRKWKDAQGSEREEVFFADLVAFGKAAEIVSQYVKKGDLLFLVARAKTEQWEDKNGGGKRSKAVYVVDQFQLMPKRDGGEGAAAAPRQTAATGPRVPQGRPAQAVAAPRVSAPQPGGDLPDIPEDDIPF